MDKSHEGSSKSGLGFWKGGGGSSGGRGKKGGGAGGSFTSGSIAPGRQVGTIDEEGG